MGGSGSSSQTQQSSPVPEPFLNQFRDMMIEAMDERLQKFKEDWMQENQGGREVGNENDDGNHDERELEDEENDEFLGTRVVRPEDLAVDEIWKNVARHNLGTFCGGHQPEVAEEWIDRLENIFQVVTCNE